MKILSRSLFFFEEEQNLSKRGTIVNEWEKLNRISNRRLKYQSLTLPLKMQWSIDRINDNVIVDMVFICVRVNCDLVFWCDFFSVFFP